MIIAIAAALLFAEQPRLQVQTGHRQLVTCMDVRKGVVALGSKDRTVTLYSQASGHQVRHLTGVGGGVHEVALGKDLESVAIRFDFGSPNYAAAVGGWNLKGTKGFEFPEFEQAGNEDVDSDFIAVPDAIFTRTDTRYSKASSPNLPALLPGKLVSANREGTAVVVATKTGLARVELSSLKPVSLSEATTLTLATATGATGLVGEMLTRWNGAGKVVAQVRVGTKAKLIEATGDTVLVWNQPHLAAYDGALKLVVKTDSRATPPKLLVSDDGPLGPEAIALSNGIAEYKQGSVQIWASGVATPIRVKTAEPPVWSHSRQHFALADKQGISVLRFSDGKQDLHIDFSAATLSAYPSRDGAGLVVAGAGHTLYFDLASGRPSWTHPSAAVPEWIELDRGERSGHGATLIETDSGWNWIENDSGAILKTLSKKDYKHMEVSRSGNRLIAWSPTHIVGLSLPDLNRLWQLPGLSEEELDEVKFSRLTRTRGEKASWTDLDADKPVVIERTYKEEMWRAFSSREGVFGGVLVFGTMPAIDRLDKPAALRQLDGMGNSGNDFSWNSTYFASNNPNRDCWIFRTADGKLLKELYAGRDGGPWMFTGDESRFIATTPEGPLMVVDLPSGGESSWAGHSGRVHVMAELPGKGVVLTTGADGATKLWRDDKELCTIVLDRSGRWAVVAPDGRFDTNRPEAVTFLNWVLPGSPFQPVPIETYMKEYFEPFLLRKLLEREALAVLPALTARTLPRIGKVDAKVGADGMVAVSATLPQGLDAAYLLRNGQLAASLAAAKKGTVTFPPVRVGGDSTLAVYGFDAAGLKTPNVSTRVKAKAQAPSAFVLAVGIDRYADTALKLKWAANDANVLAETLELKLKASRMYRTVENRIVTSTDKEVGGDMASLEAAFKWLAARSRPGDAVVIGWSGHGASEGGDFRFLTSEATNAKPVGLTPAKLRKWLLPVEASRIVLALDTCYSAATVDTPGFRPGPLGGRTFGQTAYDKAMFVVSATQSNAVALEDRSLGHGLLTFALLDALDKRDESTYTEWLLGAANHVPALWRKATGVEARAGSTSTAALLIQPQKAAVFDFRAMDWGRIY